MNTSTSSELPKDGEPEHGLNCEEILHKNKEAEKTGELTPQNLGCKEAEVKEEDDEDYVNEEDGGEHDKVRKKAYRDPVIHVGVAESSSSSVLGGTNINEIEDKGVVAISPLLSKKAVLPDDEETQSSPPHELNVKGCTTNPVKQDVTFIKNSVPQATLTMENNSSVKTLPYLQDGLPSSSTSSDCDADSEAGTSTSSTVSIDYPSLPHIPHLSASPQRSLLKRRNESTTSEDCPAPKKKRSIAFEGVTVFYFPRAQGFTCVPSQGGSTLGMGPHHSFIRKFSLGEHAAEQRRLHKQTLVRLRQQQQQQQQNQLLEQQEHQQLGEDSFAGDEEANPTGSQSSRQSSDDSDSHEEESDSDLEMDLDNYYFLQPVPTRQRRLLLRESGIKKIDSLEKEECRDIRTSREFCGCSCKSYCDPDSCSCAQAGIKCQVDRLSFPCGCSRDGCANHNGRIEFNPIRVRTHFIHTLMRIELEKKQLEQVNGNLHLGNSSLINSNAQFQNSHDQQQQLQGSVNGLGAPGSMSDISLSYSQIGSLQHQLKPHCSFQQHWSSSNVQHNPLHQQPPAQQQQQESSSAAGHHDDSQYKYTSRSLLRDVSFSSTMELESCVNAGNYTNVHFEPILEAVSNANNLNPDLNIATSQPVFHPGDELSGREDSLDLYTTFREDSYSETSDDFSNESGDNRFTPPVTSALINNSHRPVEMNFLVQNGVVNPTGVMDSPAMATGRPQNQNPYVDATYYSHNHAAVPTSMHHQQPPYHPSMIAHSHSQIRQAQPQQQPSYHNSHGHQSSQLLYNHVNPTNHAYQTEAGQQIQQPQQQQPEQTLSHIHNHEQHHSYNAPVTEALFATKTEYSNGYSSLDKISNGFGDYSTDRQLNHHAGNGDSSFLPHNVVSDLQGEVSLLENGSSTNTPDNDMNKIIAPAYTDLNTVTSYTKLEPFTEILQGAAKGACKNAFPTLQQINREEEDVENKDADKEPESHSDDDGITENFGEIIKKSMVETVSA